ncbi:MAG: branched-chain amino acid ABC transporter permease [Fimbriimonadaceae bacterium]|nr:branched-chain amino acid ABC transporter permease [Fimbriimonadaceae bacterium]QYK55386.1 MAG: branched-chain amino acid ABC transporter permease [Fimbriimonadaceae bacterium]
MKFWAVRALSVLAALAFAYGLESVVSGNMAENYRLFVLAGLYVTLAVSLNLINGITGQFSIGHAAFYMVGAYSAGAVSQAFYANQSLGQVPWLITMALFGGVCAAIAGLVVGLPSLRLRGDYLAIVTLGFGEILRIVAQNIKEVGGAYGMNVKPFGSAPNTLWLVWLLAILCIAVCRNLLRTAHGLPFLAVREDEVASSAMGVNVPSTKVTAFVIGSMFAGMAGALLAHTETFISPDMFKMDVSFIILTMVVLGGTGSITGSTVAAVALFAIPEWLRNLQDPVTKTAYQIPGSAIVAGVVAVALAVAALRYIQHNVHRGNGQKFGFGVVAMAVAAILGVLLKSVFGLVPQLATQTFEASSLRMVIFASTLIVLMLLRPQGLFGHHEFSWSWLKSLFTGTRPPLEASS